ncbi:unnamed protein product [Closterium sp. NIES-64]|nr:unnamed protein product [Closterium sp. NIES-64]
MEDCCVVCAEPLRWVAIGPCRHRDVCSMCVARLRIVMNDRRCCICKQDCPAVVVTKALGEYTRCSYDFSILPGAVKKPGLSGGDFWYEPTMHAYFDDEDHFKTMAALTRLACRVCQGDAPPSAMDAAAAAAATAASARADAAAAEATSGGAGEGSGRGDGAGGRGGNGGKGRGGKGGGRGGKMLKGSVPQEFSFTHVNSLKAHLQQSHRLGMCDLCLEGRKVFVCEQRLAHPGSYEYFRSYDDLEAHFRQEHHLCEDRECLEKKFVVFSSDLELKRHIAQMHAGNMKRAERNRVLQIPASQLFNFHTPRTNSEGPGSEPFSASRPHMPLLAHGQGGRGGAAGGGRGGRGRGGGRGGRRGGGGVSDGDAMTASIELAMVDAALRESAAAAAAERGGRGGSESRVEAFPSLSSSVPGTSADGTGPGGSSGSGGGGGGGSAGAAYVDRAHAGATPGAVVDALFPPLPNAAGTGKKKSKGRAWAAGGGAAGGTSTSAGSSSSSSSGSRGSATAGAGGGAGGAGGATMAAVLMADAGWSSVTNQGLAGGGGGRKGGRGKKGTGWTGLPARGARGGIQVLNAAGPIGRQANTGGSGVWRSVGDGGGDGRSGGGGGGGGGYGDGGSGDGWAMVGVSGREHGGRVGIGVGGSDSGLAVTPSAFSLLSAAGQEESEEESEGGSEGEGEEEGLNGSTNLSSFPGRAEQSRSAGAAPAAAACKENGYSGKEDQEEEDESKRDGQQQLDEAEFRAANRAVIEEIRSTFGGDKSKFEDFKDKSVQFKSGKMATVVFYAHLCRLGIGHVVPQLARLCPDARKREEMLQAHAQKEAMMRGMAGGAAGGAGGAGGAKQGKKASHATLNTASAEGSTKPAADQSESDSWACGICTLINEPIVLCCAACGSANPRACKGAPAGKGAGGVGSGQRSKGRKNKGITVRMGDGSAAALLGPLNGREAEAPPRSWAAAAGGGGGGGGGTSGGAWGGRGAR